MREWGSWSVTLEQSPYVRGLRWPLELTVGVKE